LNTPVRESALLAAIKALSRLPFWALYGISTCLYLLAYYVVRHRHAVVREQLGKVFPAMSEAGRARIHRRFLRNFCDVMVEIIKSITLTEAQMRGRVRLVNPGPALDFLNAGRSLLFVTSHLCNWEWLLHGVALHLGYPVDAAYKPLHDAWAERLALIIRSRFGARLVPAKELLIDHLRRHGIVRALAINADQAPTSTEQRHWSRFLGQDTAFFIGAEQIARAARLPVIYAVMRRVGRGRYEVEFTRLWDGREATAAGEITERYARACEADVFASPADWLWTYRRWRLKKPLYGAGEVTPVSPVSPPGDG
jgi:KDO2-lipid IV(A) lauroyltransferase